MKLSLILPLIVILSGCGAGNGEGLDDSGRPIAQNPSEPEEKDEGQSPDDNAIKPTLASIQEHVFTPICSTCHGGSSPAAGQNLSSLDATIASLINVSSSNPLFKRVLPGDALQSYLYLKITGDSRAGSRMPLGQPALDKDSIDAITKWINDGALQTNNVAQSTRVSRVSVDSDSSDSSTLAGVSVRQQSDGLDAQKNVEVTFWFTHAMNLEQVTHEQILISAANDNNQRWWVDASNLTISTSGESSLTLSISAIASDVSNIHIELNNSNIASLSSLSGQLLDGDADNLAGGVFTYDISL